MGCGTNHSAVSCGLRCAWGRGKSAVILLEMQKEKQHPDLSEVTLAPEGITNCRFVFCWKILYLWLEDMQGGGTLYREIVVSSWSNVPEHWEMTWAVFQPLPWFPWCFLSKPNSSRPLCRCLNWGLHSAHTSGACTGALPSLRCFGDLEGKDAWWPDSCLKLI